MCDRLVRKGLVRRTRIAGDRRVVRLALTPAGRALAEEVMGRRRDELARIVAAMPQKGHASLVRGLRAFTAAAGEPSGDDFWLGWQDDLEEETDRRGA
jgi:DNA-binding MarR family transcriptional regulator